MVTQALRILPSLPLSRFSRMYIPAYPSTNNRTAAVFWDLENCRPALGSSGADIVRRVRDATERFGSISVFRAYSELSDVSVKAMNLRSELQRSGVALVDCPHNGTKEVADNMLIVDMLFHAMDNPSSTIILISGDRDFAYAMSVLRHRRYDIVLIAPDSAHGSLIEQASHILKWDQMISKAPTSSSSSMPGLSSNTQTDTKSSVKVQPESSKPNVLVGAAQEKGMKGTADSATPSPPPQTSNVLQGHPSSSCNTTIQNQFLPLIQVLKDDYQKTGNTQSSRSLVAAQLLHKDPDIYKRIGISNFTKYAKLASAAQVVILGHDALQRGYSWIALCDTSKPSKGNSGIPTKTTNSKLPQLYEPLVKALKSLVVVGRKQAPARSAVNDLLLKSDRKFYEKRRLKNWKEYAKKAAEEGIVVLSRSGSHDTISLSEKCKYSIS
ncbi:hypothetical protein SISNIDRAFT_464423 [Sistotremastrum niveocremeum HHB9708]|uniref:NYN domain-containing protein n=1 Tax=Sistotremastrum niveocremeum HHB9708 TaxID=1314777 RepID=A0A164WUP6_9AGAM|nr:hypothetical protein SISNIDRAFT_464423 [Sistotremastrum niveocremeum HHB9708]